MEHSDSNNKNKAKNWLYRFLKIKNRIPDCEADSFGREIPHNSIRRSLKKMHSRVKSCMFPQKQNTKSSFTIAETPCTSRVVVEQVEAEDEDLGRHITIFIYFSNSVLYDLYYIIRLELYSV